VEPKATANLHRRDVDLGRPNELETAVINDLWYKNAIIYCLSVETFIKINGDGVGDFLGLMRRLDYLAGLGVPRSG
jgi:hypothetical protein